MWKLCRVNYSCFPLTEGVDGGYKRDRALGSAALVASCITAAAAKVMQTVGRCGLFVSTGAALLLVAGCLFMTLQPYESLLQLQAVRMLLRSRQPPHRHLNRQPPHFQNGDRASHVRQIAGDVCPGCAASAGSSAGKRSTAYDSVMVTKSTYPARAPGPGSGAGAAAAISAEIIGGRSRGEVGGAAESRAGLFNTERTVAADVQKLRVPHVAPTSSMTRSGKPHRLSKPTNGLMSAFSSFPLFHRAQPKDRSALNSVSSSSTKKIRTLYGFTLPVLRLLPWNRCGPPLRGAPRLVDQLNTPTPLLVSSPSPPASFVSAFSIPWSPPSPPSSSLCAAVSCVEEDPPAHDVPSAVNKRRPTPSQPALHPGDSLAVDTKVFSGFARPASRAIVSRAVSAAIRTVTLKPSSLLTSARGSDKASEIFFVDTPCRPAHPYPHNPPETQRKHDRVHHQQLQEEPWERRRKRQRTPFSAAAERLTTSPHPFVVTAFTSLSSSSTATAGASSRRLTMLESLIQMGSQFLMYPEMAKTLEEQLRTLKSIVRGESTADLKLPIYLSAEDDCLVAFDFVPDQDNGDNYHLGRVSSDEIQISFSFAQHQGMLKYKERRQDSVQISKLPQVHVQRFDLPKNCLGTANAYWVAYCNAAEGKACNVGRVDLHMSSLGDEDELTYLPMVPFPAYLESEMSKGYTYSDILDRIETPTPLVRMVFDDFRCLLHFRFHTKHPNNTLLFWLKNRQGIRVDIKDAQTNAMSAKKTSIPDLCGAEQSSDILATVAQLPDGSYKVLVKLKQYFEYEKTYEGFLEIPRQKPDKRPETDFDYYNEKQLEFDKFFPEEDHVVPLAELPRFIERQ